MHLTLSRPPLAFYGDTVVRAAFVLALFGWGIGFYGPPVFLQAVIARTGWPLSFVSFAVTLHFLCGAACVACLPSLHRRVGLPAATAGGAIALGAGVVGWAAAVEPWQLLLAAVFTGGGWVPLGAAGINAIVSPWFARKRPLALAKAYNGASVGGMIFPLLWVASMRRYGFLAASVVIGLGMIAVVVPIARRVLSKTPAGEGQFPDGVPADAPAQVAVHAHGHRRLWSDPAFLTLAAAMALGLFAQIGLLAQLFSLIVPTLGAPVAGAMMALATGCGMAGRLVVARLLGPGTDRRRAAGASYAIQASGTLLLLLAGPDQMWLMVPGVALFGAGIGNATSLPPLIAQAEFAPAEVPRVVARCVAVAQALYAFAPMALALLLVFEGHATPRLGADTHAFFLAILAIQGLAIACMLAGRRGRPA